MKINIIGSGSIGSVVPSASAIIDNRILIDVPNGIIKYIKNIGCDVSKIDTVLITHLHGDHFFDIPFLMLEKYFKNDVNKIRIYCPKKTKIYVEKLFKLGFPNDYEEVINNINVEFIELDDKEVIKLDNYKIYPKIVDHGNFKPAYGYVVEHSDKMVGFSGDSKLCDTIYEIVKECDISILDMSLPNGGNDAHMGLDDISLLCDKYNNKKIIATHMHDKTRKKALSVNKNNLIIPNNDFEISI